MPFLRMIINEPYTLRITSIEMDTRIRHWVKGKSATCEGPGCSLCRTLGVPREEKLLEVESEGVPCRWSFPPSVGVAIQRACPTLEGCVIKVTRSELAGRSVYEVLRPDQWPAVEVLDLDKRPLQSHLILMADTLESMAMDLRKEAEGISEGTTKRS